MCDSILYFIFLFDIIKNISNLQTKETYQCVDIEVYGCEI